MRVLAGNAAPQQPGPRLTPAAARFHTVINQTYTIALKFATGKPVTSRINGEQQMLYTLSSGEKAYFPLHVAEAIDSLALAPGQPFTVCHRGGGTWDIDRYHPPQPQPPQPPTPPLPPAAKTPAPQPPHYWGANETPAPPPPSEQPARSVQSSDDSTASLRQNGAGEDTAQILARCYANAIEVTRAAMEAARAKGVIFAPTHEGLQACAATLFIAETRRFS